MDGTIVLILIQDGVVNGAVYALLALSLVLVFTVTRVVFIPQGELVAFSALTYAAPPADDPLPGVLSPGAGLAAELARGAAAAPGTFGPIVAATLPADAQAGLQALLGAAGVTLV